VAVSAKPCDSIAGLRVSGGQDDTTDWFGCGLGDATPNVSLDTITIGSGANDIIGKGLIVHKDADDFKTQPTGNAGARLACGVIRKS